MQDRTLALTPIADTDRIQQIVKVLRDFISEGNLKHGGDPHLPTNGRSKPGSRTRMARQPLDLIYGF